MDYKEKVAALLNSQELSKEQKEGLEKIFPELYESDDDERIRKELIDFVKSRLAGFPQCEKFIDWLKSLKSQPEQKWSEEDKHTLQGIIGEIEANKYYAPDCDLATYDWFLSWLKSLKERVRLQPNQKWRPLGKHLEALAMAINDESLAISVRNDLNELLEQLKQL